MATFTQEQGNTFTNAVFDKLPITKNYKNNGYTNDQIYAMINAGVIPKNELISQMINKVVIMRVIETLKWENTALATFLIGKELIGDGISDVTADIINPLDYQLNMNPFTNATVPPVNEQIFWTTDKKVWPLQISYEIIAGAFTSPNNLSEMLQLLISRIKQSISIYIYQQMINDFSNLDNYAPQTIIPFDWKNSTSAEADDSAKGLLTQTFLNSDQMAQPSILYNQLGFTTAVGEKNAICIVSTLYNAYLDVNALATIFNSYIIDPNTRYERLIKMTLPLDKILLVTDRNGYHLSFRIMENLSLTNPADLTNNIYGHAWIRRGLNPSMARFIITNKNAPAQQNLSDIITNGALGEIVMAGAVPTPAELETAIIAVNPTYVAGDATFVNTDAITSLAVGVNTKNIQGTVVLSYTKKP